MNRIILIGNGFDLAHGLKTSYKDFIDDYWEGFINHCICQDAWNHIGIYQYDCIDLKMPKSKILSSFLPEKENKQQLSNKQAIRYKELDEIITHFNKEYKDSVGEIQFNIHNKFLKHLLDFSGENTTWVDIENEYYKFLCGNFNQMISRQYQFYYIEDLNPDFLHIKQKLNEYLITKLTEKNTIKSDVIWDNIYSPLSMKEFTENGQRIIANEEYLKIDRELTNSRDSFSNIISDKTIPLLYKFNKYPREILKESILLHLQNEEMFKDFFELEFKSMLFLNFNYTSTEQFYSFNDDFNCQTIHIHGELNNPDNPIIFGYGDELEENYSKLENLQDNTYLENIKSIKYQETANYKQMLDFINSDNYQVIILGHSCGNSDRTLLNTLFEHENCVSVKPYYFRYKDEKTGEIKDNYSDIVRNISRSFTDKKSMRDKVVNKTYTTWFSEKID